MDATAFHQDDAGRVVDDTRRPGDGDLDRRIRAGWEEWCDLLEGLVGSGGMLPSRELAGRVLVFLLIADHVLWGASIMHPSGNTGATTGEKKLRERRQASAQRTPTARVESAQSS